MTHCLVTVASYSGLSAALADWDEMQQRVDAAGGLGLVDAALVEGDGDTIRVSHRHARTTRAQGTIASAVVGLLRPVCLVSGAVAGGVGAQVLATLGQSISRNDSMRLGEVLDSAPINFVTLCASSTSTAWSGLFPGADRCISADVHAPPATLEGAVQRDEGG